MTRVVENLTAGLRRLLADDPLAYLVGEDIADPYGGAFKATQGLATEFGPRVLSTPISEAGFTGLACGLALMGRAVVVEMMFADFLTLAFDQIVNFASKSVTMYGREISMRLIVRCPSGGRRGYGATHSQTLHKHLIGVPNLAIYEMSALHDNATVLRRMVAAGRPCLFVEDKSVYADTVVTGDRVDDLFRRSPLGGAQDYVRLHADGLDELDHLVIAPGGLVTRALGAARRVLLEDERATQIVVPSRLYPLDVAPLLPLVERAGRVVVVEESTAGGTWGGEVAHALYEAAWGRLRDRIRLVSSADSILPAAPHLAERVVVGEQDIVDALRSGRA